MTMTYLRRIMKAGPPGLPPWDGAKWNPQTHRWTGHHRHSGHGLHAHGSEGQVAPWAGNSTTSHQHGPTGNVKPGTGVGLAPSPSLREAMKEMDAVHSQWTHVTERAQQFRESGRAKLAEKFESAASKWHKRAQELEAHIDSEYEKVDG